MTQEIEYQVACLVREDFLTAMGGFPKITPFDDIPYLPKKDDKFCHKNPLRPVPTEGYAYDVTGSSFFSKKTRALSTRKTESL